MSQSLNGSPDRQDASIWYAGHQALLDRARSACASRDYWSAFPEAPSGKIYGEQAAAEGAAWFAARRDQPFRFGQDAEQWVGDERSPYGPALGIRYPAAEPAQLVAAAMAAGAEWAAADRTARFGVLLEALVRINRRSFEMAQAVMHTTGQGFAMAFQAGGPHAQDRALEALAYAWDALAAVPAQAVWEKPQGRAAALVIDKQFRIQPRGIGLVIGCATFPTWNGYPGLFADLATGNPVLVKPHPSAILPLAMTVETLRAVLAEAGFNPDLVQLAVDRPGAPLAPALVTDPAVALIDYTGGPDFAAWIAAHAGAKPVFAEAAGVNPVVIAGSADFAGLCRNLAFSLSLYSGQMCTAPQTIFVPRGGIETDQGHRSYDQVAAGLAAAIDDLLADPARAAAIAGTIQNPAILARIADMAGRAPVLRRSAALAFADFPDARTASPLLLAGDIDRPGDWDHEQFGPIAFLVAVDDAAQAVAAAADLVRRRGALTAALHATDEALIGSAADAFAAAGVALSVNLTGGLYVNQSAAFSDYHGTGANPAATCCLTDAAFVASRFRVVTIRRPVAPAPTPAPQAA